MGNIKITRKLLGDYRRLKRQIPILELELVEMRDGDNGFNNSTVLDYRTGQARPQSVVGFDWKLYERRQKTLEHKKERCRAVERWVDAIEDGQARCVFRMFYIDGMSWLKIAEKIGVPQNEDFPRKCIRDAYLKKMKIR